METNKYYLQTKIKSIGVAYAMWFVLGMHHAYLGNWGRQFLLWFLTIAFFPAFLFSGTSYYPGAIFAIGIGLSAIGALWLLLDVFFMAGYVNSYNRRITDRIQQIELMEQAKLRDEQRNGLLYK